MFLGILQKFLNERKLERLKRELAQVELYLASHQSINNFGRDLILNWKPFPEEDFYRDEVGRIESEIRTLQSFKQVSLSII